MTFGVHQQILTPIYAGPAHRSPIDHYLSRVEVELGGVTLYYQIITPPEEVELRGLESVQWRVQHKIRERIMYEIEKQIFKIHPDGSAMR